MPENEASLAVVDPPLGRSAVLDAQRRLAGRVTRTPVVRSDDLDRRGAARLWLKAENLQRGGSFKVRGALLAVERLVAAGSRGVVAQSTGNHAISVALAAGQLGVPATLVLPSDAAPTKVRRIREAGAEVLAAGTTLAERIAVVDELRDARGLDVVDPYQDPDVVRGQGTATAELLQQVREAGARLDAVVLPVGGGSAVAGACLAVTGEQVEVVAAEPAAVPALTEALATGAPVTVAAHPTIADGLRPDRVGQLPFDICSTAVSDVHTVEEPEIAEAMCAAVLQARLLVEPAAATALAVALRISRLPRWRGRDIGVLLTGGNVEDSLVAALLAGTARPAVQAV
ncbi:threonine ammonia-lyase [Streptomyces odontomachi]|uniref:threonine ammonia-lyase n=1 Tax=Streptomyces odontomachi TaxID=2944940 RepID=UPI00210B25BB|nr:pyridoxal-phosphate dependent enzyme [Streptomyces sp. ODS25]